MDDAYQKPLKAGEIDNILKEYLTKEETYKYNIDEASEFLGLDKEFIEKLLKTFKNSFEDDLDYLSKLVSNKEYVEISNITHKLKGRTANLQIKHMQKIFTEMEIRSKNSDIKDFELLIKQLSEYNRVL
jgi:HPt (histidine-containing phosphotransfer) domain-containing protein